MLTIPYDMTAAHVPVLAGELIQELDAQTVVNTWPERRIMQILREYGDERFAKQIARAIVRVREEHAIATTSALVDVIYNAIPARARFAGGHPAKRSFQAIRIAV